MKREFLALIALVLGLSVQAAPPPSAEDPYRFAVGITPVLRQIDENYYEPMSHGALAALCIRGLYRSLNEPLSKALRLEITNEKHLNSASRTEIRNLLRRAYQGIKRPYRFS